MIWLHRARQGSIDLALRFLANGFGLVSPAISPFPNRRPPLASTETKQFFRIQATLKWSELFRDS